MQKVVTDGGRKNRRKNVFLSMIEELQVEQWGIVVVDRTRMRNATLQTTTHHNRTNNLGSLHAL